MKLTLALPLIVASGAMLASCGTIYSRGGGEQFGRYPLQAVATDLYFISKTFEPEQEFMGLAANGRLFLLLGLVSLPVDLVVDVVAAPLDVVAWILGAHKSG